MMMYGSTKFFICINSESNIMMKRLWYAPWLFKDENCSLAGLATSGTLTHWFKKEFARELKGDNVFIELAKEAEQSPPGSKGIIFYHISLVKEHPYMIHMQKVLFLD